MCKFKSVSINGLFRRVISHENNLIHGFQVMLKSTHIATVKQYKLLLYYRLNVA